jgi:solute carrier family 35 (UDP-galactose transporter), member B1
MSSKLLVQKDLRHPSNFKLLFYSLGVFFTYFYYGIIQEKITKSRYGVDGEKFRCVASMIFIQCIINAAASWLMLWFFKETCNTPKFNMALCALSYIGAMFTSNFSLQHVSYPTQVLGKSIKPVPVMILGVLWGRKHYPLKKYLFVFLITLGVLLFLWKGKQHKGPELDSDHVFGIGEVLLLISLGLDGFTGAIQDDMFHRYQTGTYRLMFYMNVFSTMYLGVGLLATGEVKEFIQFSSTYPHVLIDIGLFGLTSAVGQMFIFSMITTFGALMCSIVTTTRKFFTILGSVIIFHHPMSSTQWAGTFMVFAGLILDQCFGKDRKGKGHHHPHDTNQANNQEATTSNHHESSKSK